jgi:hypothetical protein
MDSQQRSKAALEAAQQYVILDETRSSSNTVTIRVSLFGQVVAEYAAVEDWEGEIDTARQNMNVYADGLVQSVALALEAFVRADRVQEQLRFFPLR